ncbi:MAG TPA: lysylphosphatidylglycerol synthase transmembrane domain-containing protein [Gammaproteobacteria bacterium]|nr:lysylphosphatidylglycerol synthase transmembrane domain-containing protein [Gammaproteobacteria bacterium]
MQFLETVHANRVRRLARAIAALGILALLVHNVGIRAIASQLARSDLLPLAFATVLLAVDGLAKARNWQQLLSAALGMHSVGYGRVLTWHFGGGFLGAVVPSSAGTDACRVLLALRGLGGHTASCAASILTVNALGWFTGSMLGILGMLVLAQIGELPRPLRPALLVFLATAAGLPLASVLLASRKSGVAALIDKSSRRRGFRRGLGRFVDALLVFEQAHVRLPAFLLFAACGLLAQAGMFAVTAAAVGISLPWVVWLVVVPLTRIVALVPVSVADFGLIQAAHVALLSLFGVPASQSLALSALFAVEGLVIHATLGSAAFLFGSRDPARIEPSS